MKLASLFKRMMFLTILMLCISTLTSGLAYGAQNPEALPGVAGKDIPLTAPPIPPDFKFTHLSLEEGLSQTAVISILQDRYGFMWFGTQDGLNRYDGYTFVVYRHDPDDLTSLGGNIRAIVEDPAGFLWIGSQDGGLNKYDPDTDTFVHYRHDPGNPNSLKNNVVWSIWQDEAGSLWLYMDDGWLTQFDPDSETFTHYQQSPPAEPYRLVSEPYNLKAIYQDKSGVFWLTNYEGGLASFDRETGRFTYFLHNPEDTTTIGAGIVTDIYEDRAGHLWISTSEGGLNLLDQASRQFTHFQHDSDDPYSISDDSCNQVYQDRTGTYWVATGRGLNLFDPRTGQFIRYHKDPANPYALSDDNIATIYEDRGGVLWFGTSGGGVNKLDLGTIQFTHYRNVPDNPNSLSTSYIYSIYEDTDGILWVGGDDGVLNRFDRAKDHVTRYEPDAEDPHALNESWSVSAIYEDSTGVFWVGTFSGGLHTFDRETEQFQRYLHDPDDPHSIASDIILAIYEDSAGTLWIGTDGGGLNRFDRQTGAFLSYVPDRDDPNDLRPGNVRGIYEDQLGFLWLTGWGTGLTRFDPQTEQFVNYRHDPENPQSLSRGNTYVVYKDRAGTLWVATSGGLNKFDRETETFSHYTEKDGLPNSVIYAIMEDASGNLWVSTNRGVSKFDPRTETFHNYNVFDGLQSDEFNQNAFFQSSSGEMFFGGINGLNAFYPEQITDNPYRPPVILTDLQLFNQSVAAGKDSILQRPIWDTEHITLNYDQDVFSFAFAALSYAAPQENRYRYKLEGFDDAWNEVDAKRRFATYTSLPSGDYLFRVQGANEDGVWNEQGVSLTITITPPWWQTGWFRGGAALLAASLIAGAFVWQRQSAKRRERILETQVAERTHELEIARDEAEVAREKAVIANRAKSTFLANMSHELRTPLNAILGYADILKRRTGHTGPLTDGLDIIHQSGEHLLTLINDVLDLAKVEAGKLELIPAPFHLPTFLRQIVDIIRARAEAKDLTLTYEALSPLPETIVADETRLRQVLLNLLGNAVKFTDEGHVTLRVGSKKYEVGSKGREQPTEPLLPTPYSLLRFEVRDTGPGIAPDQIERIFQPFEQVGEAGKRAEGTGLGLTISRQIVQRMGGRVQVESEMGQGSIFWFEVALPVIESLTGERPTPLRRITGYEGARRKVLVVDDKPYNRLLLHDLLEPLGFEVSAAGDGQEAVDKALALRPDAIIMDLVMPVKTGFEAAQEMRQRPELQDVFIVAVSASVLEADQERSRIAGCDVFLPKPIHADDLLAALTAPLNLTWQYAEAAVESAAPLLPPPPEELALLSRLADEGRILNIRDQATRLEELDEAYVPFARRLQALAKGFEIDQIKAFVDQFIEEG